MDLNLPCYDNNFIYIIAKMTSNTQTTTFCLLCFLSLLVNDPTRYVSIYKKSHGKLIIELLSRISCHIIAKVIHPKLSK